MSTNNTEKRIVISLDNPSDARRLMKQTLQEMFESGAYVRYPSKVAYILQTWQRSYDSEKNEKISKQIAELQNQVAEYQRQLKQKVGVSKP